MSDVRTVELESVGQREHLECHSSDGLEFLDSQVSIESVLLVSLLMESRYQDASVFFLDRVLVGLDQPECQLLN